MTFISMVLTANAQVNAAGKPEQSQACLSSAECKQYRPKGNAADSVMQHVKGNRFSVGGYGEVAYSRNFYSDHVSRYSQPEKHKNDPTHGRLDIPHVVIYLGYDFGKGWSLGTEIEFEHGGAGLAYEKEDEEGGEWEQETEKGGEVELEQFWIQKTFSRAANLRFGHIVVPVGLNNAHQEPLNFFTIYRPEGENTIMPSTWHQTGISFFCRYKKFRPVRVKSVSVGAGPVPARLPVRANVVGDNGKCMCPLRGIGLARGLPLHRATAQVAIPTAMRSFKKQIKTPKTRKNIFSVYPKSNRFLFVFLVFICFCKTALLLRVNCRSVGFDGQLYRFAARHPKEGVTLGSSTSQTAMNISICNA